MRAVRSLLRCCALSTSTAAVSRRWIVRDTRHIRAAGQCCSRRALQTKAGPGKAPSDPSRDGGAGMHSAPHVDKSALVHVDVRIGPFTVVLAGVRIEEGVIIESNCVIGPDVVVGPNSLIKSHVSISTLGSNVILWHGVRIGQDGFGFIPANKPADVQADGGAQAKSEQRGGELGHARMCNLVSKKPQEMRVVIGDDVEIGANSTIDRGSWRDTSLGAHSKLDNMVHIAHNVTLGTNCLIAAQTGIAGSCSIGHRVLIGGQVGIAQHLSVGNDARIAARSAVMHNIPSGAVYGGTPAVPIRQWHKQTIALASMALRSRAQRSGQGGAGARGRREE